MIAIGEVVGDAIGEWLAGIESFESTGISTFSLAYGYD